MRRVESLHNTTNFSCYEHFQPLILSSLHMVVKGGCILLYEGGCVWLQSKLSLFCKSCLVCLYLSDICFNRTGCSKEIFCDQKGFSAKVAVMFMGQSQIDTCFIMNVQLNFKSVECFHFPSFW